MNITISKNNFINTTLCHKTIPVFQIPEIFIPKRSSSGKKFTMYKKKGMWTFVYVNEILLREICCWYDFTWWQLCKTEAIASASTMFSIVSSIKCVILLVISSVEVRNLSYVVLTLKCVFMLIMSVTRKYFRSHFLSLF